MSTGELTQVGTYPQTVYRIDDTNSSRPQLRQYTVNRKNGSSIWVQLGSREVRKSITGPFGASLAGSSALAWEKFLEREYEKVELQRRRYEDASNHFMKLVQLALDDPDYRAFSTGPEPDMANAFLSRQERRENHEN